MPVAGARVLLVAVFCVLVFTVQAVTSANANVSEDDELSTTPRSCTAWSDFSTLTFVRGTTTQTRRRTSNIPTLNCVGNCPSDAVLEAAHCTQMGLTDLGTPSWKCLPQFAASRNGHFAFGAIRVECEGCRRRGDSEIARGSCALFYSVVDQSASLRGRRYGQGAHYGGPPGQHVDFLSTLLFLCFIAFVFILAKRICCPPPPPPVYCHPNGAVQGVPMHPGAYPGGYGYGGGGGFGTGMLTGLVVGDMLSRPHYGYGGGYGGWGGDDGAGADSGWGGGWGGGDGGGFGGSDSV